jgi:aryl-alcohol dehydrogenase-like predicted oxidoreductase
VVTTGKMLMRKIPSSGETIPAIGLGTSGPFEVTADEAARAPLREVLQGFFAGGATLIDTSPMYSTAEAVLGELLTPAQQSKAFIATKVWTPGSGGHGEAKGIEQMQRSMSLLKHRRIELMQVHNLVDLDVHLKTLRRWKAEGKIKYIGVTHYTTSSYPDLIKIIGREKLDFVQFNYSAGTREAEQKLLPLCADKGVAVLINRAFEDGNLFTRVQGKPLPPWAAEFGAKSWAQVFLKFVLAHPAVTCVIPATGKLRNLADNLAAGVGALPDARQRAQIIEAVG